MFKIKLLDRYIFRELLEPFLFGLLSFSLIFSASMVVFELVRAVVLKGMPLYIALQVFIFRLPGVVVYIFPMAMLLASLLSFARFSKDSEIVAFRAGGISLRRLVVPVLIMGLIVSLVTFYFYEVVVPESNKAVKNLLIETAVNHRPMVEENIFVPEVRKGVLQRIIYARKMEGQVMRGVIIQEFTDGRLAQIVNAKEAHWLKEENKWQFKYGTIYFLSETGEYKHLIKFETQEMAIKYSPAGAFRPFSEKGFVLYWSGTFDNRYFCLLRSYVLFHGFG
jgi:lipopolysaccharide export system permease protein